MIYEKATAEVVLFDNFDVITTSGLDDFNGNNSDCPNGNTRGNGHNSDCRNGNSKGNCYGSQSKY